MSDKSQQRPDQPDGNDVMPAGRKAGDERAARLSTALRGNLRRRKAQAKSRDDKDLGSKGPGLLAAIKSEAKDQ